MPALLLASCTDDTREFEEASAGDGPRPDHLTLNFSIPAYEQVNVGSRADDDPIKSVIVYSYDKNNNLISVDAGSGIKHVSNTYQVVVPLKTEATTMRLVANADGIIDPKSKTPILDITSNTSYLISAQQIMSSSNVSVNSLLNGDNVSLVRNLAEVKVLKDETVTSDTTNFEINGFAVYNTSNIGYVASDDLTNPRVPTTATSTYRDATSAEAKAKNNNNDYCYETAAGVGRVLIRATYKGTAYYYPIAFRTREVNTSGIKKPDQPGYYTYTDLAILRNHSYTVKIDRIRAEGWKTVADAMAAEPDNRITADIIDENNDIYNIISSRDYMLGVSNDIYLDSRATNTEEVHFLTTYVPASGTTVVNVKSNANWITVDSETPILTKSGKESRGTVGLTFADNNDNALRTGTITVSAGNLSRTVTVTQEPKDYIFDDKRKVIFDINDKSITKDYFYWITAQADTTCFGLMPNQNRGATINNGLHFPAVSAEYKATYYIPKLAGDKSVSIDGDDSSFKVSEAAKGGKPCYKVEMIASDAVGFSNNLSKVQITTQVDATHTVTITYPIYRLGIFHNLTQETISAYVYQNASSSDGYVVPEVKPGWYYYGLAQKEVGSNTFYIMDRNFAATSNAPYTSSFAYFQDPTVKGAIGAYTRIQVAAPIPATDQTDAISVTVLGQLGFRQFTLPTNAELVKIFGGNKLIDIRDLVNNWTPNSESIYVAYISGVTNLPAYHKDGSKPSENLYIPHGGYIDFGKHQFDAHANIWTRTLVSGSQGFDPRLSPDFGFWYMFYNASGTKTVSYQTLRFVNGTGGRLTDRVRYMPMRFIYTASGDAAEKWNGFIEKSTSN